MEILLLIVLVMLIVLGILTGIITKIQLEREKSINIQQGKLSDNQKDDIEEATKNLDPTDIQGLQRLMNEKRKMQDLRTLHISIN